MPHHFKKNDLTKPSVLLSFLSSLISTWVALFWLGWLYYGFFLQLNFQFVPKKYIYFLSSPLFLLPTPLCHMWIIPRPHIHCAH